VQVENSPGRVDRVWSQLCRVAGHLLTPSSCLCTRSEYLLRVGVLSNFCWIICRKRTPPPTQIGPVPQHVTRKVGKIPTFFFSFFHDYHVFDHWEPIPSGISKIFINHVRIASLGGEISHVLVTSWGTGPICVDRHPGDYVSGMATLTTAHCAHTGTHVKHSTHTRRHTTQDGGDTHIHTRSRTNDNVGTKRTDR
jgi:hypothetical protein